MVKRLSKACRRCGGPLFSSHWAREECPLCDPVVPRWLVVAVVVAFAALFLSRVLVACDAPRPGLVSGLPLELVDQVDAGDQVLEVESELEEIRTDADSALDCPGDGFRVGSGTMGDPIGPFGPCDRPDALEAIAPDGRDG